MVKHSDELELEANKSVQLIGNDIEISLQDLKENKLFFDALNSSEKEELKALEVLLEQVLTNHELKPSPELEKRIEQDIDFINKNLAVLKSKGKENAKFEVSNILLAAKKLISRIAPPEEEIKNYISDEKLLKEILNMKNPGTSKEETLEMKAFIQEIEFLEKNSGEERI
ncbi:MAG: hypothetical protein HRT47_07295 [Candidatus Caenarcaniphilales bacterium]|nr:hypothetical protein [Candidatus Caenarcaniphilales bacterium]